MDVVVELNALCMISETTMANSEQSWLGHVSAYVYVELGLETF